MSSKIRVTVPLNRVEGDMEVHVEVEGGAVTDAWCAGTMFRGFERILVGRGALDGLVITPRICGICGTSHLTAAARALESICGHPPPANATRVRNVALMTEHIQSDMRQGFLMYAADLANPAHKGHALYDEVARRFRPFEGESFVQVIRETKRVLEMIAIVGGQWPHSSYMVPGGLASAPSPSDLLQCRMMLQTYRRWYERRILGCTVERILELRSAADLDSWLDEADSHRDSDLGLFIRFARAIGLEQIGRGHGTYLAFGSLDLPQGTTVRAPDSGGQLCPAGFADGDGVHAFDQSQVGEHVAHSWFMDYDGGKHPYVGETRPYASGRESTKYSWAKAPRYRGQPAETGPLAERVVARDPLFADLLQRGSSAFTRQLARLVRPCHMMPAMEAWLAEADGDEKYYNSPGAIEEGEGHGLTHAARGALGHWVKIADGQITHYQIITPTAWNASPRDSADVRGPMEQALLGTPVQDLDNPVELGHVVSSFDPCLVCTVHLVGPGRRTRLTIPT